MTSSSVLEQLAERGWRTPHLRLRSLGGDGPADARTESSSPLGRYEIEAEIGRGGVGVVLRATDPDLGREVAVKTLKEHLLDEGELLQRFVEEAQIEGQLQHPGIVPVYELGLGPRRQPFFSMKLVKGRSLAEILGAREDLEDQRSRILGIFLQVCRTVAYAHSRKVIHRDLKPANVMVGELGEVHVVDWGFAKVLARPAADAPERPPLDRAEEITTLRPDGDLSIVGTVLGTPAYMSPEQALGNVAVLDERTDVYALGAVLFEILTGTPPQVGRREGDRPGVFPEDLRPALARLERGALEPALVDLCRACLQSRAADRPAHAGLVSQAIEAHLSDVEARAHQARLHAIEERSEADRASASAAEAAAAAQAHRRRRRQIGGLAAAILVGVLAVGGGWLTWQRSRAEQVRQVREEVHTALEEAARLEGLGDFAGAGAAARRARDFAVDAGAPHELVARTRAQLTQSENAERQDREKREQRRRDKALVEHVIAIRLELHDEVEVDPMQADADFAEAFETAELDLSESGVAIRQIRGGPEADEIAGALVEWAAIRLHGSPAADHGWRPLLAVACGVSPADDPRVDTAVLSGDSKRLRRVAEELDLTTLSARDAERLALLLDACGASTVAGEVVHATQETQAGDLWLSLLRGRVYRQLDPPRPQAAIDSFAAALALSPASACLWHQLGQAYLAHDDDERALAAFRHAVEHEPRHACHFLALGRVLADKDYPEQALTHLRQAVALDPESASAWHHIGFALQRSGLLDEACSAHRKAVRLAPERADFHRGLGSAHLEKGDVADAVAAYQEAIRLVPGDAPTRNNLGAAYLRNQQDALAAEALEHALTLEPELRAAHYNLAIACHRIGKPKLAVSWLQRFRAVPRGWLSPHSYRGTVVVDEDSFESAVAVLRAALAQAPRSAVLWSVLGHMFQSQRADEAALEAFEQALELDAGLVQAYLGYGIVLNRVRRHQEAIHAYKRAVEIAPDDARTHTFLAYGWKCFRQFDKAVLEFQRAVDLDPEDPSVHEALAGTLDRLGRRDEAAASARRAIALDPTHHHAHNILGSILINGHMGAPEALRAFRAAVRLRPGNAMIHMNLGNALSEASELWRAAEEYRRALELDPHLHLLYVNLGGLLCDEFNDYPAAIEVFRRGLALAPDHHMLRGNLAVVLRLSGKFEESLAELLRLIEQHPNYLLARMNAGLILANELGRVPEGVLQFREAIRIAPKRPMPSIRCARALVVDGRWEEAVEALREATQRMPGRWLVWQNLAWHLAHLPDAGPQALEEAHVAIGKATDLENAVQIDLARGAVLYRLGRYEQALAALESASSSMSQAGWPALRAYMALVQARLGRDQEAAAWLTLAQERHGDRTEPPPIVSALLEEARALLAGKAPR